MMNIGDLEPLISSLDFPYICRICLKRKYLKNFEEYQVLLQLFRNITDLGNDLEENLPKNVCFSCIQKLENILEFIECSKVNDSCLRQVLSNERVKQELFVDEPVCNFKTELISESDYDIKVNEKTPGFSKNVVEPAQGKNDTESRKNQSKTCSFCGECFSTQRGILSHIKLERACRKLFIAKNPGSNFCNNFTPQGSKCSICGKDFSSKACLSNTSSASLELKSKYASKLCQKYFGHQKTVGKNIPVDCHRKRSNLCKSK
ncbi:hypothetical protein JTB14_005722 [Gonioctena quinquepunctata]|nr:hypothetical protein JTB14_005722 [Gonioctena quinquepunctata]